MHICFYYEATVAGIFDKISGIKLSGIKPANIKNQTNTHKQSKTTKAIVPTFFGIKHAMEVMTATVMNTLRYLYLVSSHTKTK